MAPWAADQIDMMMLRLLMWGGRFHLIVWFYLIFCSFLVFPPSLDLFWSLHTQFAGGFPPCSRLTLRFVAFCVRTIRTIESHELRPSSTVPKEVVTGEYDGIV